MEGLKAEINLVALSGGVVSPALHLQLRKYFENSLEDIMDVAQEIATAIIDPLLQQSHKPSDGSIELLDLLGTLLYVADQNNCTSFSKWLFSRLMKDSWSIYASSSLFSTTILILTCNNTSLNISNSATKLFSKMKNICLSVPTTMLPELIKTLMTSIDLQIFSEKQSYSWIEFICIELIPRVSYIDTATVFYIIELSFQYSSRLASLILTAHNTRTNQKQNTLKALNPREIQSKCILLLLLSTIQRYQDLSFQEMEEQIKTFVISLLRSDSVPVVLEICYQILDYIIEYPGMETRSQIFVEFCYFLLETVLDTQSRYEVPIDIPIRTEKDYNRIQYSKSVMIPVTFKIAQYGLFLCFIRWESAREFILKESFMLICQDAPSSLLSHSLQLINHKITEKDSAASAPISIRALILTQLIETLVLEHIGTMEAFQTIIFEWFSELSTIREEIALRIQFCALQIIRIHQNTMGGQIMMLLQKQKNSNYSIERKLALRGLCFLFSFFHDEKEENLGEFLIIMKSALNLPQSYRKSTYDCICDHMVNEEDKNTIFGTITIETTSTLQQSEFQFPKNMKNSVLDLLVLRMHSYTYKDENNKHRIAMELCYEIIRSRKEENLQKTFGDLITRESFSDLVRCIILLSKTCSNIEIITHIEEQLCDLNSVHSLIFSSSLSNSVISDSPLFISGELIPPIARIDTLIPLYQVLIDERIDKEKKVDLCSQELLDNYTILLYIRYHSLPNCKWNSHWNNYLTVEEKQQRTGETQEIKLELAQFSLCSSLIILKFYATKLCSRNTETNSSESLPLLNIFIQVKWILVNLLLHSSNCLIDLNDAKKIFDFGSQLLIGMKRCNTEMPTTPDNHREQLVELTRLLKILPSSGGIYEKLILHCTSQNTTSDLLDAFSSLILKIFAKVLQKISPLQREELGKQLRLCSHNVYSIPENISGNIAWLHWNKQLLKWLQDEFTTGISVETLQAYLLLICNSADAERFKFVGNDNLDLIEEISSCWLDILRNYSLEQPKVIRTIITFLFALNSLSCAIPLARCMLLSILNEPSDPEELPDEDDERLLITETKSCRVTSLRIVLDFYKDVLTSFRKSCIQRLDKWKIQNSCRTTTETEDQEIQVFPFIIPPAEKKLIGDLLTILQFVMTERMEFVEQNKQLNTFSILIGSLLITGSFCCSVATKKNYKIYIHKELQQGVEQLENMKPINENSISSREFPCSNFLLLLHSITNFCYQLDSWISDHRQYLKGGKLPELVMKKEKFLVAAQRFLVFCDKEVPDTKNQIKILQESIKFVNDNETRDFLTMPDCAIGGFPTSRKRKRIISSNNTFINKALEEEGGDYDDFSDLEDFVVTDET